MPKTCWVELSASRGRNYCCPGVLTWGVLPSRALGSLCQPFWKGLLKRAKTAGELPSQGVGLSSLQGLVLRPRGLSSWPGSAHLGFRLFPLQRERGVCHQGPVPSAVPGPVLSCQPPTICTWFGCVCVCVRGGSSSSRSAGVCRLLL